MIVMKVGGDPFRCALVLVGCWLMACSWMPRATAESTSTSFRAEVAPILIENCVPCHCARKAEGNYRIDTFAEMLKTGDSGITPLTNSGDSKGGVVEFVRRMKTSDESERMPLDGQPLSEVQIQTIENWIAGGAKYDGKDQDLLLRNILPPRQYPTPPTIYPSTVPVTAVTFSPIGDAIFTGGYHEILVWSIEGQLQRRIQNIGQQVFAIDFHPDNQLMAVASGQPGLEGEVRLVDSLSGAVNATLVRSDDVILDVAFSGNGKQLAVACADKSIRLIDLASSEEIRVILSHADWVTSVAWNHDDSRLVSGSRDKSAKIFDIQSGQLLGSYQGHNAAVRGVAFLPSGSEAVSSGADGKLHRWNIETTKKIAEVGFGGEGFKITQAGSSLFIPTNKQLVYQIDPAKNSIVATLTGHSDWVLSTDTHPDGMVAVSGAYNGEIKVWKIESQEPMYSWLAKP